ncbi:MAG TPA: class I SAM-dependent methyltransferase, partial [Acidimicrobiales bacterium]|nr:class I SAM-dependent methyltransferase [Acidimicrobiales bacterium]
HPHTISQVFLRQPQTGVQTRYVTRVRLTFTSGPPVVLHLGTQSRSAGQTFHFAPHASRGLTVTITDMTGSHTDFSGASGVGFSEIQLPGVGPVTGSLRLPTDLLAGVGAAARTRPLVILLHRLRAATVPPRTDPELAMSRTFTLPAPRRFTLTGTARASTRVSDALLDTILGRGAGSGLHVVSTDSSTHLTGSLTNASWAAFDDDAATSWSPAFLALAPQWLSATLSSPVTVSAATFRVVDDGRHSLPTSVRITSNTGATALARLTYERRAPAGAPQGRTVTATVHVAPIPGTTFRFAFPTQRTLTTTDHVSGLPIALPIGIADVVLPGVAPATTPAAVPGRCVAGLVAVDGVDVPVRVTGSTSDALAQRALTVTACRSVSLAAGTSVLTTTPGTTSGWNLDTLELSSPGTAAGPAPAPTAILRHVHWTNPTSLSATLGPQSRGSWLVLDQSFSTGWHATAGGHDLGPPVLLDGGYTAWPLAATTAGEPVQITWAPQSVVNDALLVSLVALLALIPCIVYGARERRRRRRLGDPARDAALSLPWHGGARPRLALAACGTVAAMVFAGPAVALAAVPLVVLAWRWPRLRAALALAPAALLGLAGAYVLYEQDKYGWPHDIQWPTHFGLANTLGWLAVSLLLVDVAAFGAGGAPLLRTADSAAAATPVPPPAGPAGPGFLARILPSGPMHAVVTFVRERLGRPVEPAPPPDPNLISLPGSGLGRSLALFRAFRREQQDPDYFYRTIALDTLHRLTGATPLFNRTVVDVGGGAGYFAEAFRDAGARVILVEPEAAAPLPRELAVPEDQLAPRQRHERAVWPGRLLPGDTVAGDGLALPLPTNVADLVFSSNVLEHVRDPGRFIDEAVRVTRPGGLVYLSYTVWWGPWGGHETSPWHLLGGRFALRRYTRKHGHP